MTLLFEKYAGAASMVPLVQDLTARVVAEPSLASLFAGANWQDMVKFQVALLSAVMDGPQVYRPSELSRLPFRMRAVQFTRFSQLLEQALAASEIEPRDQATLLARFGYLRARLVLEPAGGIDFSQLQAMVDITCQDMQRATQALESARERLLCPKDAELAGQSPAPVQLRPASRERIRALLAGLDERLPGSAELRELRELLGAHKETV